MWTRYRVTWNFTTSVCGSVPADPEIVKVWLESRKPRVQPPGTKSIDEINEEVLASLAEGEEFDAGASNILTFQRHQGGLCMRGATIKAHLKDCARVLQSIYIGKIKGEQSFATKVLNAVYPDPALYWVPLLRPDGTPITKHDGERDKAIHVSGPRGRMNALKRFEFVDPARMDFTLHVVSPAAGGAGRQTPAVSEKDLATLMMYGGTHGYAGERGDGEGKYTFTLTRLED
jgi:hypothetical protein